MTTREIERRHIAASRREWDRRAPFREKMDELRQRLGLPLVLLGGPQ